ncbi:MAG: 50S ribosomal protein L11 methyltransferase [Candidatus Kapabacteria bacterium]|nr:50S ribosomal protein L11 methyltransferase [Candidatus Kapabacteria bacterium]
MKTRYVLVTISLPEEQFDLASGVLSTYPMVGIEEGMDSLTVCFEQNDWHDDYRESIINELTAHGVNATITLVGTEEDQNWNAEWEASIEPVIVNERIVIAPEWRAADYADTPLLLVITPKMSFGTGHHATTRMMCRLMETRVEEDSTWIDVGTGTGVLAILAARLGARHVYAFDNSEWSILNSEENIRRNGVADRITLEQIELQEASLDLCDGLAANLYRHLVIPYAPAFVKAVRPGGVICVSGILKYDVDEVAAPFLALGCVAEETLYESEWAAIAFRTPA